LGRVRKPFLQAGGPVKINIEGGVMGVKCLDKRRSPQQQEKDRENEDE